MEKNIARSLMQLIGRCIVISYEIERFSYCEDNDSSDSFCLYVS